MLHILIFLSYFIEFIEEKSIRHYVYVKDYLQLEQELKYEYN